MEFDRITVNPMQMGGVPCIRGMRMPVATILRMLADGWTREEILADWPEIEPADIHQCTQFASAAGSILEGVIPKWVRGAVCE